MARIDPEPIEGPAQHQDWDRMPNISPEEVHESSRKAEKELNSPKEQPDHNRPEPTKNTADYTNSTESDNPS